MFAILLSIVIAFAAAVDSQNPGPCDFHGGIVERQAGPFGFDVFTCADGTKYGE